MEQCQPYGPVATRTTPTTPAHLSDALSDADLSIKPVWCAHTSKRRVQAALIAGGPPSAISAASRHACCSSAGTSAASIASQAADFARKAGPRCVLARVLAATCIASLPHSSLRQLCTAVGEGPTGLACVRSMRDAELQRWRSAGERSIEKGCVRLTCYMPRPDGLVVLPSWTYSVFTLPTRLDPTSTGARAWLAIISISLRAMSPPCQAENQRSARQYSAAQFAVGSSVIRSRNT